MRIDWATAKTDWLAWKYGVFDDVGSLYFFQYWHPTARNWKPASYGHLWDELGEIGVGHAIPLRKSKHRQTRCR